MTLHQRFAGAVARFPERTALELDGTSLTYRELGSLCEGLASRIAADLGRTPRRVGLLSGRSLIAYAGYLAVQRLGATCVPLSPKAPSARNAASVAAAGLDAVLSDDVAADLGVPTVTVSAVDVKEMIGSGRTLGPAPASAQELAYVLFTSGSTGTPKGVPIRHENVASYLDHVVERYEIGPGARLSQNFELTFDLSVFDLYAAWTSGATLVAPSSRDLLSVVGFARRNELTHWFSVPSVVSYAMRRGSLVPDAMPALKWSLFCGEPLTVEQAAAWQRAAPRSTLENLYGPTELTISCAQYRLPRNVEERLRGHPSVPIGTPYPHLQHIVVDENGTQADTGELCVRGPQRFDGYLDPAANEGRFVELDENGVARRYAGSEPLGERHWYRTGDRVQAHEEGWLYLGRLDNQVKVRGHRVELEEVEWAVRDQLKIAQAVVLAVPDDHGDLCLACVLPGPPGAPDAVVRELRDRLPEYMIPQRIVYVDELPLNGNGKIDRRAAARRFAAETEEGP
ncbi:D-alanine--poly(phosphoribitol) ligase [Amycolatopsis sp. A1MSW2902]|uniref:AMP-binding protein n=1 Tax=Amycolatopsis sp. A1MSW2902 TaxID=687413 RepID=UPI00307D4CB3